MPNFSKMAAPPHNLTPECQNYFETLKFTLTTAPVIVKADVTQPFLVTTDASSTHVEGVLSQVQPDGSNKPIGYFQKKLSTTEARY